MNEVRAVVLGLFMYQILDICQILIVGQVQAIGQV